MLSFMRSGFVCKPDFFVNDARGRDWDATLLKQVQINVNVNGPYDPEGIT